MATRVNVTSVEAIESFRASLVLYLSQARPTLAEINSEVTRTRVWLQCNQRVHWEGVFKRRARILEEAKAALFSAKMSTLRQVTSSEQMAVAKAKRAMEEAEEKLRVIRRWDRDFDNQTEPLARQLEKLHTVLSDDLAKAVIYLAQTVHTLDAYAGVMAPGLAEASGPSAAAGITPLPEPSDTAAPAAADEFQKGAKP